MTISNTAIIKKMLVIFLVFIALYFGKDFFMPLCIGGILSTLFLPLCRFLENKKWPKSLAVFMCLIALSVIILSLFALVGWKISALIDDVGILKEKGIQKIIEIQNYIFNHLNVSVKEQNEILKAEKPSVSNIVEMMFGSITSIFSNFILVLVYFVFLLYYKNHIRNFILKFPSRSDKSEMEEVMSKATYISQQYLLGLFKMIVCLWIMYGIGFSIIGVENAIFFAILCGLLEIVPFVGNLVGTTITVLIASINGADLTLIIGILVTYGVVQFIQGWILEPLIVGAQVKINSLFTIIALVVGQLIWGISGIILAIPLTAIFKIICDHVDTMKHYGFLIGEIEVPKKEVPFVDKLKTIIKPKT